MVEKQSQEMDLDDIVIEQLADDADQSRTGSIDNKIRYGLEVIRLRMSFQYIGDYIS